MRSILGVSWIRACPIKEEMDYLSFFSVLLLFLLGTYRAGPCKLNRMWII